MNVRERSTPAQVGARIGTAVVGLAVLLGIMLVITNLVMTTPDPGPGDPATWRIDPTAPPSADARSFTALVSRSGCNGGVTGTPLEPEVVKGETWIAVSFDVVPKAYGGECPTNDLVPYEVHLGEELGDRSLVDGRCLQPGSSPWCERNGIRWTGSPG